MITYKKGDLLADEAFALVNTVNMGGVMGKGIALSFKKEFPFNYRCYQDACQGGLVCIGKVLCIEDNSLLLGIKLIINFPTKIRWWLPSEYFYIEAGLKALVSAIEENQIKSIAIPALGCGNGGLDWNLVKSMIESHFSGVEATINIYEPIQ
jgi:O-acetyl-ADP-ribose deacetylase (regulator of RNase III)